MSRGQNHMYCTQENTTGTFCWETSEETSHRATAIMEEPFRFWGCVATTSPDWYIFVILQEGGGLIVGALDSRLDYQPLFGKMSPRSSPPPFLRVGTQTGPEGAAENEPTWTPDRAVRVQAESWVQCTVLCSTVRRFTIIVPIFSREIEKWWI